MSSIRSPDVQLNQNKDHLLS